MSLRTFSVILFMLFYSQYAFCQTDSAVSDELKVDTVYYLENDTLFSNVGFSIYVGQHLYLGKGSSADNLYTTIGFKSLFAFPLWFMRETELKNNFEYSADPSKRDRDKLQGTLWEGKEMVVKKIKPTKYHKQLFYYVFLKDTEKILSYKYRCSIVEAIHKGEIKLSK